MAEAEAQTQQPSEGSGELEAAFRIVRQVRKANLKWLPQVFNEILYEDTALARPAPRTGYVGDNEILMKNVYYLATKTHDVDDLFILTLVDSDCLTVEEGNTILAETTNKLRAVKLYAVLVEKEDPDGSITSTFTTILRQRHDNEVLEILKKFNIEPPPVDCVNDRTEEQAQAPQQVPAPAVVIDEDLIDLNVSEEQEGWSCGFCTYRNSPDSVSCYMCYKTPDFLLDDSVDVQICPHCTLINTNETNACVACEYIFEEAVRLNPGPGPETDDD